MSVLFCPKLLSHSNLVPNSTVKETREKNLTKSWLFGILVACSHCLVSLSSYDLAAEVISRSRVPRSRKAPKQTGWKRTIGPRRLSRGNAGWVVFGKTNWPRMNADGHGNRGAKLRGGALKITRQSMPSGGRARRRPGAASLDGSGPSRAGSGLRTGSPWAASWGWGRRPSLSRSAKPSSCIIGCDSTLEG